jgi:signal peptidase II
VNSRAFALCISAIIFVLDRTTKVWIEKTMSLWDSYHVIPGFFDIVHAKNRGAAFGMFSEGDHPLRTTLLVGVSVGVLLFISYLLLRPGRAGFSATRLTTIGLALVFGGALGNIYDRVFYGAVTDFLEFYSGTWRFAAFNVADSAITIGAGFLILDMWRTRKPSEAPQTPDAA